MGEFKETTYGPIPIGWQFIPATEYCLRVTDGTHDSPKPQKTGMPLVTSKHIKGRSIDFDNAYLITKEDYDKINQRSAVQQWDVIISMIGTCGVTYVERNTDIGYAVKNVGLFKTGDELKARWLDYYLKSNVGQSILEQQKGGTTQEYIALGALRNLPILVPTNGDLKAIVTLLSSLDAKIDLLHRQNKTLEAMAEALFRQWFVEEAVETWEEMRLDQFSTVGIGRTPPRKEQHWFSTDSADVKWISIKDMAAEGPFIFTTAEYLTEEAVERFRVPVIPKDTVVLSFKMTLGRVKITTEAMLSNEAIAHFRIDPDSHVTKEFLYLGLKTYPYESLGTTSTIVDSINSGMIKGLVMQVPPVEQMDRFMEQCGPWFEKIRANQLQIQTLTALRDTLLPKLMSGEVRVEEYQHSNN